MLQKTLIALLLAFATMCPARAADMAQLTTACASCHGQRGEGNPSIGAPRLAGQDSPYLDRQLRNFSSGKRAYNPQDALGVAMRSAVKGLVDADMLQLATYYSRLAPAPLAKSVTEHSELPASGQLYLSTCAACHGLRAQGYPQLQAPNLNILDGEYIARQLESFDKGWRGDAEQSDQPAVWMRSIATHISTKRDLADAIQYIVGFAPAAR